MDRFQLEICCGSTEDAMQAARGGAHRVELCSALFLGGLTPSLGSLRVLREKEFGPEIVAMVRPRPAGFCYSAIEFEVLKRDADLLLANGADGIVFGILRADGTIDTERCRRILDLAAGRETVFHRAFDVVPDPLQALDELIDLKFTRVLTSGQQPTALQGSTLIRQLVERARGRIEILPGGGIRSSNVQQLLAETGCTQAHATASKQHEDPSTVASSVKFGSPQYPSESAYQVTDHGLVEDIRHAMEAV